MTADDIRYLFDERVAICLESGVSHSQAVRTAYKDLRVVWQLDAKQIPEAIKEQVKEVMR